MLLRPGDAVLVHAAAHLRFGLGNRIYITPLDSELPEGRGLRNETAAIERQMREDDRAPPA